MSFGHCLFETIWPFIGTQLNYNGAIIHLGVLSSMLVLRCETLLISFRVTQDKSLSEHLFCRINHGS